MTVLQENVSWYLKVLKYLQKHLSDEGVVKAIYADMGLDPDKATKLVEIPADKLDSIARYTQELDPKPEAFIEVVDDIIDCFEVLANLTDKNGRLDEAIVHSILGLLVTNFVRFHLPWVYWFAEPAFFLESIATGDPVVRGNSVFFTDTLKNIGAFTLDLTFRDPVGAFKKIFDTVFHPIKHLKKNFPLETEADAKRLADYTFMPFAISLAIFEKQLVKNKIESPSPFAKHETVFVTDAIYAWDPSLVSTTPIADRIADRSLTFSVIGIDDTTSAGLELEASLGFTMTWVPRVHADPGLLLALGGSAQVGIDLGADWDLILKLASASAVQFHIKKDGVRVHGPSDASAGFVIEQGPDDSGLPNVIPSRTGTRLEFERIAFSGDISTQEAVVKLLVQNSALVLAPSKDADGFIKDILPSGETRISFDLGLGFSSQRGFYVEGGTGLEAIIPIGKKLGPVIVHQMMLSMSASSETAPPHFTTEISAGLGLKLGPIAASVERIGVQFRIEFLKDKSDFSVGFKPPNGVGLAIDARGVEGGGFLLFDREKGQYAGVLEVSLNLERVAMTLKAVGLINTKLPDGTKGFSLVVILTAEFMVPLGLGFTLTGLGVILGIHRTFNETALQAGVKNHTLDKILFPKDPISNAPALIAALGTVFPAKKGHHFIGGMVQITWGDSPLSPLLTMTLGIAVEFGERSRLLIMGQIKSILPTEKQDLVRFHLDAIGIIDFDQKNASIDATLYDSRLAKSFAISGEMAMRSSWGNSPNFALAIGGFHPAFNAPTGFPKLKRVAINLSSGDNPRIRCEAYFALTSNTVQFGARAELVASGAGFTIQGDIGFDVLIQRSPFHFIASFHAQVQLKRGSTNLFKVKVEGSLEGPRPLHVTGKATFEILWWDVSIRIDKTLVKGEPPTPAESVVVMPLLRDALNQPANWKSALPDGQRAMVTLRTQPGSAPGVLLHPLGTLTIKQTVVPLNFDISKFGPSDPSGLRRFTVTKIIVGNRQETVNFERDFFAPAQFIDMKDNQKLSRPSFEKMDAGVSFGSTQFRIPDDPEDRIPVNAIQFETLIIDKQTNEPRPADPLDTKGKPVFYQLSETRFRKQARFGAAGSSELRRVGAARYRTVVNKYQVAKEGWTVIGDDLAPQRVGVAAEKPLSYAEAEQALSKLRQQDPVRAASLKILRPSDLKTESV